jgi:hypothetical protein
MILRFEFILYFSCHVKNAFLITLIKVRDEKFMVLMLENLLLPKK